jgi:hypothetical protein
VVLIHPFYRDFMQDWYKTRDFSAKISWKPAGKNLSIVVSFVIWLFDVSLI